MEIGMADAVDRLILEAQASLSIYTWALVNWRDASSALQAQSDTEPHFLFLFLLFTIHLFFISTIWMADGVPF